MGKRKPERDSLLTVVARAVGSALGTVSTKVTNLAGSNWEEGSGKPKSKARKSKSAQATPQPRKQSKRTKTERKPTNKKTSKVTGTRGRR
jgi:hypothetical protein